MTETSKSGPENLTLQSCSYFVSVFIAFKIHCFQNLFIAPFEKVGLYWICFVLPSFLPSVHHSVHPHQINFRRTFSENVRVTKLKLVIHIPSRLLYLVYRNQGQGPIALRVTSFDRFYNLPLMKNFHYRFLRSYESSKSETRYTNGKWDVVSCISERGPWAYNS